MKLNEAGVTLIDCDHKTPAAQASGYPYVGIPQLKDGHIRLDGARLISEEDFVLWTKKAKPQLNDVILSRRCNPGESAYVPDSLEIALGQNLVLLRSDGSVIYPPFLRWLVQGNEWWEQVNKFLNVGAVFNSLKCKDIPNFKLTIPSLKEQKRITDILSGLDKKIELNNKINQNLESIAQAIFKSWFIDFEPVRVKIAAKQEGSDPELAAMCVIRGKSDSELEQMVKEDFAELQATAALFPDELVESELGEVPKGWTLTLLKDVTTELRRGISPKYTEEPNGAIVINQKCIRNHTINFSLARKHDSSKRKIDGRELQIGDVLVNSTGVGTLGRIASVRYLDSITVVDSHVTVVRANDKKVSRAYLQGLLLENEKFIEASGAGTTGQTELRKEVLQEIKFPNPAVALHQQFDSIIYKINQEIANLEKMNISLSHVRNTLLPKLLSGELDMLLLRQEGA